MLTNQECNARITEALFAGIIMGIGLTAAAKGFFMLITDWIVEIKCRVEERKKAQ